MRHDRLRRDIREELDHHLAMSVQWLRQRGYSEEEALREANRRLGRLDDVVQDLVPTALYRNRRMRFRDLMAAAAHDIRYAARSLGRSPVMAVSVIATLAICTAALSTVLSVVNGVLVRGLPYREPEQLFFMSSIRPERSDAPFSLPEFMDFRADARTADLAAYGNWSASLATGGVPQRLQGARLSANAFAVLGAQASAGRLLNPTDDEAAAAPVVVISYGLWRRQFAMDSSVVGRRVVINEEPYTVVGVLPRHFPLPLRDIDVIAPLSPDRDPRRHVRGSVNFLRVFGRPTGGAAAAAVQADMARISAELRRQYPVDYATKLGVRLTPMNEYLVGSHKQTLLVILGGAGLLLAIALANILNLLMMRALVRQPEIGVRRALGASGGHIAAVLLAEGTVLATCGGALGALASIWLVRVLSLSSSINLPRLDEVIVDPAALGVTAAILLVAVALFSLAPFAIAMRADPQTVLRAGGRSGVGTKRQTKIRAAFVVAEVAFAVMLATATGAVLESLLRLQRVPLGFDPSSVFMARLSLPPRRFPDPASLAAFAERLQRSLQSDPAVVGAGMVSIAPLSGLLSATPYTIAGRPVPAGGANTSANLRVVTPGYLSTIGAEIVAGRGLTESDDAGAPHVALISRALAERDLAGVDPIGQQVMISDANAGPRPVTVVGVLENLQHVTLDSPPAFDVYLPLPQTHPDGVVFLANNQFWTVKVKGDVASFGRSFLAHLQRTEPTVAAARMGPMADYVDLSLSARRVSVGALLTFAMVSLVLAALGTYGVMAYGVEQRRREIGVRLALGASPANVVRLVLGQAATIAGLGVAAGIGGALLSQRALSGMLFGVSAGDPRLLATVALVLLVATVIAGWIPAARAARIDPATTVGGQ